MAVWGDVGYVLAMGGGITSKGRGFESRRWWFLFLKTCSFNFL